jgi:hypothetical protein
MQPSIEQTYPQIVLAMDHGWQEVAEVALAFGG